MFILILCCLLAYIAIVFSQFSPSPLPNPRHFTNLFQILAKLHISKRRCHKVMAIKNYVTMAYILVPCKLQGAIDKTSE